MGVVSGQELRGGDEHGAGQASVGVRAGLLDHGRPGGEDSSGFLRVACSGHGRRNLAAMMARRSLTAMSSPWAVDGDRRPRSRPGCCRARPPSRHPRSGAHLLLLRRFVPLVPSAMVVVLACGV
jgi:hypothetical protein